MVDILMAGLKEIEVERLTEEIDLDLLVLIERYATDLLKWDLLAFFGNYPEERMKAEEVAKRIGRGYKAVRSELADLAILGVLYKSSENGQLAYQLTFDAVLRSQVIKLAKNYRDRSQLR